MPASLINDEVEAVNKPGSAGLSFQKISKFSGLGVTCFLIISLSVIIGFWFRIKGLGKFPLAVDEYFIVKSAQNILKYGIPQFESGGYYVRGIIQQYITAALMLTGIKAELASRLIPLISNLLVISPLYKLGKKLSGQIFAAVLVSVFCFSVWEIEMARFARMYAPFQALFTWYLLYFYEYAVEEKLYIKKRIYILSFISIFLFEAGILLILFNLSILLFKRKLRLNDVVINALLFIFAFSYLSFDFMSYNTHQLLPAGISIPETGESFIILPKFMLTYIPQGVFSLASLFIISLLTIFTIFYILTTLKAPLLTKLTYSFFSILSLFHLFGVLFLFLLLFLTLNRINTSQFKEKPVKLVLFTTVLNLLFWLLFTVSKLLGEGNSNSISRVIKETAGVLIKYPNFNILTVYLHAVPVFTITAGFLLGILFTRTILSNKSGSAGMRFLLFVIVSLILIITFLKVNYNETRYTFFLFPVVLILTLYSIRDAVNSLVKSASGQNYLFIIAVFLLLFISEDFSLHHIININSKEVNYRIGINDNLAYHYYLRWDGRTPAEIINKSLKNDDTVIINYPVSELYLKRVDYVYNDYRNINFINSSTNSGTKERWTNAKLIYRDSDLLSIINNRVHTIWLIADNNKFLRAAGFYENYKSNLVYTTFDGKLYLYKFPA